MLYQKDFQHLRRTFGSEKINHSSVLGGGMDKPREAATRNGGQAVGAFLKIYMLRSTLHGVRYIVENELKLCERCIWAIIVVMSIFATAYISILLANRFYSSPLQTVVESTIYSVYNILYPAVTICNYNRVDWTKVPDAIQKFIPNSSKEVEELFTSFVSKMELLEYGNFDQYDNLRNVSLAPLDHINMSALSEFLASPCEDMFEKECWWRYKEFPCCEIFVKQKSEYGFCYSFNSVVNGHGIAKWKENKETYPVRTSGFGDWSGLRFTTIARSKTKVPGSQRPIGISVIVHFPFTWPNNEIFVPAGTSAVVALKPRLSYAMESTRRYDPISRECIFADEAKGARFYNVPGLNYHMTNCISGCRQHYMVQKCNCSLETFFPLGNYKPCTASDFHCFVDYDGLFNFVNLVHSPDDLREGDKDSMLCTCLHECSALDYQTEILPMHLPKESFYEEKILLDIHFQHGTLIKYRTDVVYGWLDLLVAFGGIAGLFMGASVLSGVEIFYYFTIGIFIHIRDQMRRVKTAGIKKVIPINNQYVSRFMTRKIPVDRY